MKTLEIENATASLADYVRNKEPVIVSRKGKPVAALVPIENADWETASLSTDPRLFGPDPTFPDTARKRRRAL